MLLSLASFALFVSRQTVSVHDGNVGEVCLIVNIVNTALRIAMQLLKSSAVDFMRVIMFTDCVQVGLHGDIYRCIQHSR
jgi:hypothetical protein